MVVGRVRLRSSAVKTFALACASSPPTRSSMDRSLGPSASGMTLWFDGPDPELLRQIVVAAIQAQIYRR